MVSTSVNSDGPSASKQQAASLHLDLTTEQASEASQSPPLTHPKFLGLRTTSCGGLVGRREVPGDPDAFSFQWTMQFESGSSSVDERSW